jgi:molybdopterin converting factor small subunit
MQVKIRMMGVLREAKGLREVVLDVPEDSTVGAIIKTIIGDDESLRSVLWDAEVDSPSPNALVMLDGIEVSNLQGTDTIVVPNKEMVLLSVVHGG